MDYKESIFERIDLQQIRAFLLYGAENNGVEKRTYREKLKTESSPIYKRLKDIYEDKNELDKAVADLSQALTAYEEVYTEIGMKFGARIVLQLLQTDGQ